MKNGISLLLACTLALMAGCGDGKSPTAIAPAPTQHEGGIVDPSPNQGAETFPLSPRIGQEYYTPDGSLYCYFRQTKYSDASLNFLGWHLITEGHQKIDKGNLLVCHREKIDGKWKYIWVSVEEYRRKYDTRLNPARV